MFSRPMFVFFSFSVGHYIVYPSSIYGIVNEFMVFNVTFNTISTMSWRSVLLVEETGVPRENHRPVVSHWQTLSHNVVSSHWQTLSHNVVSSTPRRSSVTDKLYQIMLYIIFSKYFNIQFSWPTFQKRSWTVMTIMSTNRKK